MRSMTSMWTIFSSPSRNFEGGWGRHCHACTAQMLWMLAYSSAISVAAISYEAVVTKILDIMTLATR